MLAQKRTSMRTPFFSHFTGWIWTMDFLYVSASLLKAIPNVDGKGVFLVKCAFHIHSSLFYHLSLLKQPEHPMAVKTGKAKHTVPNQTIHLPKSAAWSSCLGGRLSWPWSQCPRCWRKPRWRSRRRIGTERTSSPRCCCRWWAVWTCSRSSGRLHPSGRAAAGAASRWMPSESETKNKGCRSDIRLYTIDYQLTEGNVISKIHISHSLFTSAQVENEKKNKETCCDMYLCYWHGFYLNCRFGLVLPSLH